jgi:hypothetical protein
MTVILVTLGCSRADAPDAVSNLTIEPDTAELTTTIGLTEGPEEYLFGDITSVAADPTGRIYVADRIASSIRVYDPDGGFVAQIGRGGQGPGEFAWIYDIAFGSDDRMYVRDGPRISVFDRGPAGVWDSFVTSRPHLGYPRYDPRRGAADSLGRYFDPNYLYPSHLTGRLPVYSYAILETSSLTMDTLPVPSYANIGATRRAYYLTSPSGGRLVDGLSHAPFEAVPAWTVTQSGTVVGGDGDAYTLIETNEEGDTLQTIHGPRARRPVLEAAARDSAVVLRARLAALPVPLSQVFGVSDRVQRLEVPDSLPSFIAVYFGGDRNLWVEQWPDQPGSTLYDVLSPSGEHLRSVFFPIRLEREPPPYFAHDAIIGVVRDTATDIERVVRLRIRS